MDVYKKHAKLQMISMIFVVRIRIKSKKIYLLLTLSVGNNLDHFKINSIKRRKSMVLRRNTKFLIFHIINEENRVENCHFCNLSINFNYN